MGGGGGFTTDDKADEVHLSTYDSKRDRYNGFDTEEYAKVVDRFEAVDAIRQVGEVSTVRLFGLGGGVWVRGGVPAGWAGLWRKWCNQQLGFGMVEGGEGQLHGLLLAATMDRH